MTTKQINDLISFIAMNAMNGVDNKRATEWITEQNLDKDIADHLQCIVDKINNCQQYIVTLRGTAVFHECSLICSIPRFSEYYIDKVKTKIKNTYNLEVYDFTYNFGIWSAWTDNTNVKVFIEPVCPI